MYDPKSSKAEEFICHEEILDTLAFSESKKQDKAYLEAVVAKAEQCKGLDHREALALLDCELPEVNERIFALARRIKQEIYGNRIVMFAPLYLSNYCVNGCLYCPYHYKNKHIPRKKLT